MLQSNKSDTVMKNMNMIASLAKVNSVSNFALKNSHNKNIRITSNAVYIAATNCPKENQVYFAKMAKG